MSDTSHFPSLAQLVVAIQRLDADVLAGWVASGDEARERLRNRVRRLQAASTADALAQFARDQDDTAREMLALLNQWAMMLEIPRRVEAEVADLARHANSNDWVRVS